MLDERALETRALAGQSVQVRGLHYGMPAAPGVIAAPLVRIEDDEVLTIVLRCDRALLSPALAVSVL